MLISFTIKLQILNFQQVLALVPSHRSQHMPLGVQEFNQFNPDSRGASGTATRTFISDSTKCPTGQSSCNQLDFNLD